jgi:hypothetical protein
VSAAQQQSDPPFAMVEPTAVVRPRSNQVSAPLVSCPMYVVASFTAEHTASRVRQQQGPQHNSSKHAAMIQNKQQQASVGQDSSQ